MIVRLLEGACRALDARRQFVGVGVRFDWNFPRRAATDFAARLRAQHCDRLIEMDEINGDFPQTDVALVIGANDVTNPAARNDQSSPIFGMPILDVDKAHTVMVIKRSMNPGFAGIDNELYYQDKTLMLFGDAKGFVGEIVKELPAMAHA